MAALHAVHHTSTVNYPTRDRQRAAGQQTPSFPVAEPSPRRLSGHRQQQQSSRKSSSPGPDVLMGGGYVDDLLTDTASWGNAWYVVIWCTPDPFISELRAAEPLSPRCPKGCAAGWYELSIYARAKSCRSAIAVMPIRYTSAQKLQRCAPATGRSTRAGDKTLPASGAFKKGAYVLVDAPGGPAASSAWTMTVYAVHGADNSASASARRKDAGHRDAHHRQNRLLGAPGGSKLSDCAAFLRGDERAAGQRHRRHAHRRRHCRAHRREVRRGRA